MLRMGARRVTLPSGERYWVFGEARAGEVVRF